jgi:hypothetical protein
MPYQTLKVIEISPGREMIRASAGWSWAIRSREDWNEWEENAKRHHFLNGDLNLGRKGTTNPYVDLVFDVW